MTIAGQRTAASSGVVTTMRSSWGSRWGCVGVLMGTLGVTPESLWGFPQNVPDVSLAHNPLFNSMHHVDARVSQIGKLVSAMFLDADRLVFVDGASQELVFVDLGNDFAQWAGRKGEGPGEFKSVQLLTRSGDGGIVVWDTENRRLNLVHIVEGKGVVSDAPAYDRSELTGGLLTQPVARFSTGALVFRTAASPDDNVFALAVRDAGRYRDKLQYWLMPPGERRRLIVEGLGTERYSSVFPTGSATLQVIFGHSLLHAQVGEYLAVAQTDWKTIRVFDRLGRMTTTIPLLPGVSVPQETIEAVRDSQLRKVEATAREMAESQGSGDFDFASIWRRRSDHIRAVPANEVAPPIDRMRGDSDGRLWLRLLRPGDAAKRWQVWDLTGPSLVFTLRVPEGEVLLDAAGNRVLVRGRDEFDVDYLVVKGIVR